MIAMALVFSALLGASWWIWSIREARHKFVESNLLASRLPTCEILFVGSSMIEYWRTLPIDMAPLKVINLGVAGSLIDDVTNQFADQRQSALQASLEGSEVQGAAIRPASNIPAPPLGDEAPQAIVFYAGDNDIASGRSVESVHASFIEFLAAKRRRFGDTPVYFISLKPSPARWQSHTVQAALNRSIEVLAREEPDLAYVDIVPRMLINGQPGPYYVDDALHMNAAGYSLWTPAVKAALSGHLRQQQAGACHI